MGNSFCARIEEIAQAVPAVIGQHILARVKDAMDGCKVIILSDYAKGVLSLQVVTEITKLANDKGVKVLVDPKGRDFSL